MTTIPPCAIDDLAAPLAQRLYAAYNRGGNPERMGLNYQDKPCPEWPDLPQDVREKWQAVADFVLHLLVFFPIGHTRVQVGKIVVTAPTGRLEEVLRVVSAALE